MKVLSIVFIFATLLISCQKELSVENGRNDVVGLLRRTEAVTNGDTMVTQYYYDNLSRLETVVTDGITASEPFHQYINYTRDFTSRIITVKQQTTQSGYAYDTIITSMHYPDPVGLEYDYCISTTNLFGFLKIDSTAFAFTGAQMMTNQTFTTIPNQGVFEMLTKRNEFLYDSTGNVETRDYFTADQYGSILLTTTFKYSYSDEPDYLWYSVVPSQNYWLVGIPNLLNKNVKQLDVIDQTGSGVGDVSILTNLTIGAGNKPVTGEVTIKPLNQKTRYTFYYQ